MSDLGMQPREVWKQPDRLPAEGGLGSSKKKKNPANCGVFFCCLLSRLCICAACLAFGVNLVAGLNSVEQ
jgi:hypothetical protein